MTVPPDNADLYGAAYFADRLNNDTKRIAAFEQDAAYLRRWCQAGRLLDVGCSTGEFLDVVRWQGEAYGMEVSDFAVRIAQSKGIRFDRNLFDAYAFFDVIVFRGTIQHIDTPFAHLKASFEALKPGGHVVFLATPNAAALYYRLWQTLPFLDPPRNFWIPSDRTLRQSLLNFGFDVVNIDYPYLATPYARPLRDLGCFALKLLGADVKFPFFRNMIRLAARKKLVP